MMNETMAGQDRLENVNPRLYDVAGQRQLTGEPFHRGPHCLKTRHPRPPFPEKYICRLPVLL
jgi:hypothetical protein